MNVFQVNFFVGCLSLLVLAGCPRLAHIEIYNNTSTEFTIDSSGAEYIVKPEQIKRFKFGGDNIKVNSELGVWEYPRNIPRKGEDGPYFNGTLKLQINSDGFIYALKISEEFPIENFQDQPKGYPLMPNSKTKLNINWDGNEEDGYGAKYEYLALYVSPMPDNLWSWSVTSTKPLALVTNHVYEKSPKKTSVEAKKAAEDAARHFVEIQSAKNDKDN